MQQVDLYQQQFKPKKVVLPPRQILFIIITSLVIFIALSLYSSQKNTSLAQQISALELKAPEQITPIAASPLLTAQLNDLQQQQDKMQTLLDHLNNHDFGNKLGFSTSLHNLAFHRVNHVWLTAFSFIDGGETISLSGKAVKSTYIPHYLDSLSNSEGFQGKQFSVFQLQQPQDNSDLYSFKLHTHSN